MAYLEQLAARVRRILASQKSFGERKMFGGLAIMVNGHMTVGVNSDNLMVRVWPDKHVKALAQPHARPMDFTGRR
jgi:TfoX/Sxy family transcriptional regulator of competence genes